MLEHDIYPMYLKSHDSSNDAPNDNGPNGKFKAHYDRAFTRFKTANPGERLTPALFNGVLSKAWVEFKRDPTLKACIIKAFAKTLTWPLVDILDGEVMAIEQVPKYLANEAVSSIFCTDQADINRREVESRILNGESSVNIGHVGNSMTEVTFQRALPGTKEYSLLITSAASHYFETSWLTPAREQAEQRQVEKAARNVRISRPALTCLDYQPPAIPNGGIPDTTTGHCGSVATYNLVGAAQEAKKEKESAKKRLQRKEQKRML